MSKVKPVLTAGRPSAKGDKQAVLATLNEQIPTKRVNFDLPVDLHTQLKLYAANQGMTIKDVLSRQIELLIRNEN